MVGWYDKYFLCSRKQQKNEENKNEKQNTRFDITVKMNIRWINPHKQKHYFSIRFAWMAYF